MTTLKCRKLLKEVGLMLLCFFISISTSFSATDSSYGMSASANVRKDKLKEKNRNEPAHRGTEATNLKKTGSTLAPQQEKSEVRGTISDESGAPLAGVSVSIKGTTQGVISDINGYYIIEAKPGEVVLFSYIGFRAQEHTVGAEKSLNVTLKEDIQELDEAVVVGMGTQRKASVIGSISSVKISDLRTSQPSLTANLSGRIAGTVAVQRSGEPGADVAQFWIRGLSTFGSNQVPLMLVDGVERNINDISIDEIDAISILKDASATAVYGSRAANGVVVITTRKGVAQKPSIEVKMEYGLSDLPHMPEYLDGPNYARLVNEVLGYDGKNPVYSEKAIRLMENPELWYHPYLYPNVNWFDEVFKDWSNRFNATINVRGGSDRAKYFVSAGYLENNGNMRNMKGAEYNSNPQMKRYNFRSNVDITITPTTNLQVELGAVLSDLNQPGEGNNEVYGTWHSPAERIFYYANLMRPVSNAVMIPVGVDGSGNQLWEWGAPTQTGEHNPAERLMNSGYQRTFRTNLMSQAILNQKLDFITEGLSTMASFSFDSYNTTSQKYTRQPQSAAAVGYNAAEDKLIVLPIATGAEALHYAKSLASDRAIELKWQLMYDRLFNQKHRIGAMFMYYQRDFLSGAADTSIKSLPERKQGIAGRATYSYGDRYFAEFNIGYNGSENFPKNKRFGVFPAGAVGYIISNESFWRIKPVSFLKLRASIGLVGNESLALVGSSPLRFGYTDLYTSSKDLGYAWGYNDFDKMGTGVQEGLILSQIGISNLTWEKGLKKNVGFEMKLFDNRFSVDFDYFHEERKDILTLRSTIPGFAGFSQSNINLNKGKVRNHGFDTTVEYNGQIDQVGVRVYGNFTYTTNKIKEKDEAEKAAYMMERGHRIGQQFGLIAIGLFKDEDDINSHPSQDALGGARPGDVKYLDYNGDGVVDLDDQTAIGYSRIPEIVYGFGTQFIWKDFDFGVFFRGQDRVTYSLGGDGYIPFRQGVGKGNIFVEALDRWTPDNPNPDARFPRMSDGGAGNNWVQSTRNIYNGRLLRLANLELGYTLPHKLTKPVGLSNLRFYFVGDNLALFSKWKMWDPETGTPNGNKYPNTRNMSVGIKANF